MNESSAGCIALILLLGLPPAGRPDYSGPGRLGRRPAWRGRTQWRAAARANYVRANAGFWPGLTPGRAGGAAGTMIEAHTWFNTRARAGQRRGGGRKAALGGKK